MFDGRGTPSDSSIPPEGSHLKSTPRGRKDRNVVVIEKIETEGDRQLKTLVEKQLGVKTTLHEQLSKRKAFTTPTVYEKAQVSGQLTFHQYQQVILREQRIEALRTYQLTPDEIQLVVEHENMRESEQPTLKKAKYGIDPSVEENKLQAIYDKIQAKDAYFGEKTKDEFKGVKKLTRHEMDLEKAIASRNKETTTLTNMLLGSSNRTQTQQPSEIKSMLKELEHRVYGGVNCDKIFKPHNKLLDYRTLDQISSSGESSETNSCEACERRRQTDRGVIGPLNKDELLDFHFCGKCRNVIGSVSQESLCGEAMDISDAVVDDCARNMEKKIVLTSDCEIPADVIRKYRLNLEEIRQLPRFSDYSPGEHNKTLYLKNLSSKVTEEDLPALFLRFQRPETPKIVFKLLKGKMRGQAFVTFHDADTAKEALELVNGYNFKGKPVIIQYANKH